MSLCFTGPPESINPINGKSIGWAIFAQLTEQCRRADWRHLVNTIELVHPSPQWSPQPQRQIDRFIRFCTAHGRKSNRSEISQRSQIRNVMVNSVNSMNSKGFTASPIDMLCANLADEKSTKSCVIYLTHTKKTKFRLALPLSLLNGSRPKSAGASPKQCSQSDPDFVQIGSLSAELYPHTSTPSERAQKWIKYSAEASLRAEYFTW